MAFLRATWQLLWLRFQYTWRHKLNTCITLLLFCAAIAIPVAYEFTIDIGSGVTTVPDETFSPQKDFQYPGVPGAFCLGLGIAPATSRGNHTPQEFLGWFKYYLGQSTLGQSFIVYRLENSKALEDLVEQNAKSFDIVGGVVFNDESFDNGMPTSKFGYTIRLRSEPSLHHTREWFTNVLRAFYFETGPEYDKNGFLAIQDSVDKSYIKMISKSPLRPFPTRLKRFPTLEHKTSSYFETDQLSYFSEPLAAVVIVGCISLVLEVTRGISYEKETGLKVLLKTCGVSDKAYWLSWFLYWCIPYVIMMAVLSILFLSAGSSEDGGNLGTIINQYVVFLFLLLYATSTILLCFVCSLVNSTVAATALFMVVYLVPACLSTPLFYEFMSKAQKLAMCLLPNFALKMGALQILIYCRSPLNGGLRWDNVMQHTTFGDNFSIGEVFIAFAVDILLFMLITWYFSQVFPGPGGVPKPWLFPFQWLMRNRKKQKVGQAPFSSIQQEEGSATESFQTERLPWMSLFKLTKVYGKRNVVNDVTLDLFEGETLALLGGNASGKSTLLQMITGLLQPTSGSIHVCPGSAPKDISAIRDRIGLCRQQSALFDFLTVEQHLVFIAKLRRMESQDIKVQLNHLLDLLNLENNRYTRVKFLSTVSKSALSLALSLMGNPKVIALDEPTQNMDPCMRHRAWEAINQSKQAGSVIVLSTQSMQEAEALADRIGVLQNGSLVACGTMAELEEKYERTYVLRLVKANFCRSETIKQLIEDSIEGARIMAETESEIKISLPKSQSPKYAAVFEQLEEEKVAFGVSSFGISLATLDELYLRIARDSEMETTTARTTSFDLTQSGSRLLARKKLGRRKFRILPLGLVHQLHEFFSMFWVHALVSWRRRWLTCSQLILLVIVSLLTSCNPEGFSQSALASLIAGNSKDLPITIHVMNSTSKDPFIATVETDDSPWAKNISGVYKNVVATVTKSPPWNQTVDQFLLETQRKIDSVQFANEYMIGVSYEIDEDGCHISTGLYNGYAYHSMPLALNLVNNALVRYLAGDEYSISVNNYPLPSYGRHMDNDLMDGEDDDSGNDSWKWWPPLISVTYTCIFLFVMSALLGSFAISPVEERTNETKLLLIVSGSTGMTYWLSRCCWDIMIYSLPVISVIGLVLAGQTWPLYIADRQQETLIILVVLFGWATLPLTYLLSFKFETGLKASAYIMITFTTIGGYCIVLEAFLLYIVPYRLLDVVDMVTSFSYPEITGWIFTVLFPPFNLVGGLLNFYINDYNSRYCHHSNTTMSHIQCNLSRCIEWNKNQTAIHFENRTLYFCMPHVNNTLSFQYPGFGKHALFLFIQGFAFLVILIIVETHVLTTWYKVRQTKGFRTSISTDAFQFSYGSTSRSSNMTNTLKSEQSRIKTAQPLEEGPVQVSVRKGEALGILGLDDRGKETLFRMLTGDVLPSDGTSFLEGVTFDSYNGKQVRLHVGYCPKSCSLMGDLTCREMLYLIGRLRGVTETDLEHVIDDVIECCLLTSQADDVIDSCSAGTKRKLSTAIALIGKPTIIFLDDPTTSVDPLCRRKIWSVLQEIRQQGTTLVLTTNSTEESEMQCTRVTIMIDQRFVTMGSPQSLKNVYGDGVNIEIRLTDEEEIATKDLISFISSRLPGGYVTKENNFTITFKVLNEHIRWGQLFQTLEEARTRFTIADYSIQQCTLEAAFLHLSRAFVAPTSVNHSQATRSFVL